MKGVKKPGHETEITKEQFSRNTLPPSHGPNGNQMVRTSDRSNLRIGVLGKFFLNASAYIELGFCLTPQDTISLPNYTNLVK